MKHLYFVVLACFCTLAPIASANSIYTWNFASSPNASMATSSYTYVSDGLSISANGTGNLFYKAGGAGETGLGLACCDDDHEIGRGQSITLNLSNLFSHHVTGITLVLDSIQSGESGQVCDSLGLCATISSSQDATAVSILNLYRDMKAHNSALLIIKAGSGDVLLNQLQVTTGAVPEPGGLFLMGTGLVLVATGVRRKLRG